MSNKKTFRLSPEQTTAIIDRAKTALKATTDTELSRLLGGKENMISLSRDRGSINLSAIIAKLYDQDMNWLIKGQPQQPAPSASPSCDLCHAKKEIAELQRKVIDLYDKLEEVRESSDRTVHKRKAPAHPPGVHL